MTAARARTLAVACCVLASGLAGARPVASEEPGPGGGEVALAAVSSAQAGDRIVLATGPLLGVVEPCRCTEGMLGGLPRRAALLDRLRGAEGAPLVELGDLGKPSETSDALIELRERAALEALALTSGKKRPHAVALGCTDLRLGLDRLERIVKEVGGGVTLLATNLRPKSGSSFVQPELVAGDVVVIAVIDPILVVAPEGWEVGRPRDVVAAAVARHAGKRLVVLFHGEPAAAEAELGEAKVDAILCGHGDLAFSEKRTKAGVPLLALDAHGQYLHALALGPSRFASARHPLDGRVPDRPAVREALDRFYEKASRLAPEVAKQKVEGEGGRFVGSKACAACHEEAFRSWQKTGHARALLRLREKDPRRAGLAECTACHVTGAGYEGGWSERDPGPDALGAVGCEECHGVGSNHVERAWAGEDVKGFARRSGLWPARWRNKCILCHDSRNSPGFELAGHLERIKHWTLPR